MLTNFDVNNFVLAQILTELYQFVQMTCAKVFHGFQKNNYVIFDDFLDPKILFPVETAVQDNSDLF